MCATWIDESVTHGLASFRVDDALFAVQIRLVREINRHLDLTVVRRAPEHVRGLINLRGQLVTIVDLGARLGLGLRDVGASSHLIVLKTNTELVEIGAAELRTSDDKVGLLVDEIGDVVSPTEHDLEPPPAHLDDTGAEHLAGVCKRDAQTVTVLDVESLLRSDDADSSALSA